MDDITHLFMDVAFPTDRATLIAAAREGDASAALISRLEALDDDRTYATPDAVQRALTKRRAESNPALVSVVADVCENCGFMKVPGEPHSCIEAKAQFAETVRAITDEFEQIDDRADRSSAPDAG